MSAKLTIDPELLAAALFPREQPDVYIVGASYNMLQHKVVLELDGPAVPKGAKDVLAIFHRQPPLRVEFKPARAPRSK